MYTYTLPPSGEARQIGANVANDVKPASFTTAQFNFAAFGSFGSGVFASAHGDYGSYVICGAGGHGHPSLWGKLRFDFDGAGTWTYTAAANSGVTDDPDIGGDGWPLSQTNGYPYYEITGATQVPACPHPYQNAWYRPPSLGGGTAGSYVYPTRNAVGSESYESPSVHRFDLASNTWSRENTSESPNSPTVESSSVWLPTLGRVYIIPTNIHSFDRFYYYAPGSSPSSGAFAWGPYFEVSGGSNYPPSPTGGDFIRAEPYIAGGNEYIVMWRDAQLLVYNATTNAVKPSVATVTGGTLPSSQSMSWAWHPARGAFYGRTGAGGSTLYKLVPPAGDPVTGTWTLSTETLGGDSVPTYSGAPGNSNTYRSFFYHSGLGMFVMVAGGANPVTLINPAGGGGGAQTCALGGGAERERAGGASMQAGAVGLQLGGHRERETSGGLIVAAGTVALQIGGGAEKERAGGGAVLAGAVSAQLGGVSEPERSGGLSAGIGSFPQSCLLGGVGESERVGAIAVQPGAVALLLGGAIEREAAGGVGAGIGSFAQTCFLGGLRAIEQPGGIAAQPGSVVLQIGGVAERESFGGVSAANGIFPQGCVLGGGAGAEETGGASAAAGGVVLLLGGAAERERFGGASASFGVPAVSGPPGRGYPPRIERGTRPRMVNTRRRL